MGEPSLEWIIQPQISPPTLSLAMSAPVKTARQPGAFKRRRGIDALDVGVRMRGAHEHGIGLAGTIDVVGYWPLPVMNRWSSLRRTGAPIPVVAATGFLLCVSFCACRRVGQRAGIRLIRRPGACRPCWRRRLSRRRRCCGSRCSGTGCHRAPRGWRGRRACRPSACTRSTAAMIMPGVQKPHCRPWCWRKASCMGCSLPSVARPSMVVILAPVAGGGEHGAGLGRAALDVHDAGAALAGVAAHVRAGEAQMIAQELDQQHARVDLGGDRLAVHGHGHMHGAAAGLPGAAPAAAAVSAAFLRKNMGSPPPLAGVNAPADPAGEASPMRSPPSFGLFQFSIRPQRAFAQSTRQRGQTLRV